MIYLNKYNNKVALAPVRWIKQPNGYNMVSMEGEVFDGTRFSGKIVLSGCSEFNLSILGK